MSESEMLNIRDPEKELDVEVEKISDDSARIIDRDNRVIRWKSSCNICDQYMYCDCK